MRRDDWELLALASPGIIYLLVMAYFPMVGAIVAFKTYLYNKGIFGSPWDGLQNFQFFFRSQEFLSITRNTIGYNLAFILLGTVAAIGLAILMFFIHRNKGAVSVYQTVLFLPYFSSWIVVEYIVYGFLSQQHGLIDHAFFPPNHGINWYESPQYWPYILTAANLWHGVGFSTLIYFAGIMGIDPTYFEVAAIDGASRWQIVRRIMIPMLSPLIAILVIIALGSIFNADFGLFYFVPNNSAFLFPTTQVINTYVFRALIDLGQIGMSAAVGLYQSVVGLGAVILANYVVKKLNPDNALW